MGEHGLLAFGGADAIPIGLEAGRGGYVPGAAAEEAQDLAVQAVYALADVFDARAVFGRFQETSPRTWTSEPAAVRGASKSVLRER